MGDKSSDFRVVGLTSIRMGEAATNSAATYMPSVMHTLGNFVPDSANMLINPEDVTNFFVEDKAEPDCQLKTPGTKILEFATRDMGNTMMVYLFGGAASGVTVYAAPITAQVINEKAIEVITKPINGKKFRIEVPRTSVAVGGSLRFGRSETGTLTVSAIIMQPYSSIPPFKMHLVD